jgi:hypothetical protein
MRILMVHPGPDFSVHDVFAGWHEALTEAGIEVAVYNTNDRLIFYSKALIDTQETDETGHPIVRQAMDQDQAFAAAMQGLSHALYTFWPDVVLFVTGFFTTAGIFSLIRQRRHKIVLLHTESPYQDEAQLLRGEMADLNLLNDPANLDKFDALGVPAVYMPHAYRPAVHYPRTGPLDPELAADLTFIGTAFRSRIDFFTQLNLTGLDVLLGGNEWGSLDADHPLAKFVGTDLHDADCVDNEQTAGLYRHARSGINFYRRESEPEHEHDTALAMGPREVEMAACGLFYLRDPREEGDRVLPMLPTFSSPADASEQLRWWLAHDREREMAASAARVAIADRTFASNAKRLLTLLEKGLL